MLFLPLIFLTKCYIETKGRFKLFLWMWMTMQDISKFVKFFLKTSMQPARYALRLSS